MRYALVFCWSAAALAASAAGSAAAEPSTPYKAYVVADDVYVRSGPGKNYYPTAKLKKGDTVEVYRRDPGGWLALKPPGGSFAWISGRYLELGQDGLATVTGDQVAARVGSRFSDVRDVIQVRLHRGEIVQVLGKKRFAASTDRGTWYKIAPPSGEFRWIYGKYVDPDYLTSGVRRAPGRESPLLGRRHTTGRDQASGSEPHLLPGLAPDARQPDRLDAAQTGSRRQWTEVAENTAASAAEKPASPAAQPAVQPAAATDEASGGAAKVVHAAAVGSEIMQAAARQSDSVTYVSPRIPELKEDAADRVAPPRKSFARELSDIDFELSVMLAEEPTVWSLEELQIRAQSLLGRAETALQRGRARLLMNRLAQSADIKQRYDRVHGIRQETERENRQLAALGRNRAGQIDSPQEGSAAPADDRFDGSGRLARVVTPEAGAPRFALVDEKGDVDCYVSPAPGVNLRYYVGRRVGISGIRGFLPERKAPHVTAKHVTPLDAPWLR